MLRGALRSLRPTAVIAVTIPSSILAGVLLVGLSGFSLNMMTLAGLAIAIGWVVDDGIVVLENMYRHILAGESNVEAGLNATREVGGSVFGSTIATIAVFAPLAFIPRGCRTSIRSVGGFGDLCATGFEFATFTVSLPAEFPEDLEERIRTTLPRSDDVEFTVTAVTSASVPSRMELTVSGPRFSDVAAVARQLEAGVREIDGLINVSSDVSVGKDETIIRPDLKDAAEYGLTAQDVARQIGFM